MISFDEADFVRFYVDHPVQQFLILEETGQNISSVNCTESWASMAIHEIFHHFQYSNPNFRTYAKGEIGFLTIEIRDLKRLGMNTWRRIIIPSLAIDFSALA